MTIQSAYQGAIKFAAQKHHGQTIPGTELTYVIHLSNVAMEILIASEKTWEFNSEFAVQVALLHDTLEDTKATFEELSQQFGVDIANGVMALTKNDKLAKQEKMYDSINRIKQQPKEVWAVKLADRITNLQKPPAHWDLKKISDYRKEAIEILSALKGGNEFLEQRLSEKISEYEKYCFNKM